MPTTKAPRRPLSAIARDIKANWPNVNYAAKPYLNAMSGMGTIDENYFLDPGREIVLYFLSNAKTWRGEAARNLKKELNNLL